MHNSWWCSEELIVDSINNSSSHAIASDNIQKSACKSSLRTFELKELKCNIWSEQTWKHLNTCDASKTDFFSTFDFHKILKALRF